MGIVGRLAPAILKINRLNPTAGRIAYNAVSTGVGVTKKAAPIAGKIAKAVPVIGAGFTAYEAANGYNRAIEQGDDPGRAAFRGIGRTIGGFGGGIGGGAAGTALGPVGTFAGGIGGNVLGGEAGDAFGGSIYDYFNPNKQTQDLPASAQPMTVEEQRQRRREIQSRRAQQRQQQQQQPDTRLDIGGFKYSREADPSLVGLRLQTQSNNIDTVQGYSRDKFLISNQSKVALGQQGVDRYDIGQSNQTERYGIGQRYMTERQRNQLEAGTVNRRTDSDTTLGLARNNTELSLGLAKEGTSRYSTDAQLKLGLDTNRTSLQGTLAGYQNDVTRDKLKYADSDSERNLKRYGADLEYKLKDRNQNAMSANTALQILGGLYGR